MKDRATKVLLKRISEVEDELSLLTTRLWKLVEPTPEEIESVRDVMAQRQDKYDPTDLEVLQAVVKARG